MITSKVIGGDKLLKKFKRMGEEAEVIFKEVVDETAVHAHAKQVGYINQNVKTGTGHLRSHAYVDLSGTDFAIVGNSAEYAGYVEFGTGRQVSVPPEFSGLASKIKARKTDGWKVAMERIRDWLKMRGYDVKNAYPMYINIVKEGRGVRPRPFLYPAYLDAKRFMGQEAAKALKKLAKVK